MRIPAYALRRSRSAHPRGPNDGPDETFGAFAGVIRRLDPVLFMEARAADDPGGRRVRHVVNEAAGAAAHGRRAHGATAGTKRSQLTAVSRHASAARRSSAARSSRRTSTSKSRTL